MFWMVGMAGMSGGGFGGLVFDAGFLLARSWFAHTHFNSLAFIGETEKGRERCENVTFQAS